ncbi:CD70 antigen [Peromyscus californicus insignis]|uniref:CD70 antigen n=1 Tax=Peromyscus californicus insignis TaxID=564181 RepID=UPI0022A6731F|nr:CD70 antigen [Peromyscus californicus insignis]
MVEEGRPCPWVLLRPSWNTFLRFGLLMVVILFISCLIYCVLFRRQQQTQLEPLEVRGGEKLGKDAQERKQRTRKRGKIGTKWVEKRKAHLAELQLNLTVPRKDLTLHWEAGPTLGRSFTHGPGLEKGQLYIHRDGIYRLHIQVTLANCSVACSTVQPRATVTVSICSPAGHSISLLRLHFGQSCTVASQRLTRLAIGDILCTNLTLPLLPSRNADETFFGVHWVYP